MSEPHDEPLTFNTLSHYEWPATPADESIRRFRWKLWQRFNNSDDDPFISDASLKWASRKRLDRIASPPACDPVMREMQATFCHWIDDEHPSRWLQLVVLPPCDANDLVQTWARSNGHHVIEPPAREILLDRTADVNVTFDCDAPLVVIPQLERWFLRHQDGMCHVRKLLRQAARAERHCVIGCNSWAWQFLDNAVGAGRLLPLGLAPNAFDANRLRTWLMDLAEQDGEAGHVFRMIETGGVIANDFFAKLAARSLGIPWVAWQLWRRALRIGPGQEEISLQKFPDEKTLWVSKLEEFKLPNDDVDAALLSLHALLIHDGLTAEELDAVTPSVDAANVLPSLIAADVIEIVQGRYQCIAAAYPAIRSQLIDAGFSRDKL